MWPKTRLLSLLGLEVPIIQAPMAGAQGAELAIAVSEAGGLGSLPCAMLSVEQMRAELELIRQRTRKPINVNFFCHRQPVPQVWRESRWRERLAPYYVELGVEQWQPRIVVSDRASSEGQAEKKPAGGSRRPFDEAACAIVEEFRPEVVSFHFGLPAPALLARVKATGAKVLSSATTVAEARWLEAEGCDAIIAQGFEAGGHRGMFLSDNITTQVGTMALVPQVVDAVRVPVIAAGGIGDARGIVAAFALGAAGVQLGTAYLGCPEAKITPLHREALRTAKDDSTVLTNVISGRPARGIANRLVREVGPMSELAPAFPLATGAIAPLRAKAEAMGSAEFSPLGAGGAGGWWGGWGGGGCRGWGGGGGGRGWGNRASGRIDQHVAGI